MKFHLIVLALCTLFAPAIAQPTADTGPLSAANAKPNIEPVETDFGWTITPVVMPEDNAATMLGMKFWRFKIESPDKDLRGNYKLQLRRDGRTPITIQEFGFTLRGDSNDEVTFGRMPAGNKPSNAELTFGLMPIGDKPSWEADEMKISTLFRMPNSTPSINDSASVAAYKNPVKDLEFDTTMTGYAGTGTVNADGSIVLTNFLGGTMVAKTPTPARTITGGGSQLVLVFTAAPKAK